MAHTCTCSTHGCVQTWGMQCKHSKRMKCGTHLHTCMCKHTAHRHVYIQQMCTARACTYRRATRMAQACTHVRHRYSVHTACMCVQQSVHLQAQTSRQINCMHVTQRSAARTERTSLHTPAPLPQAISVHPALSTEHPTALWPRKANRDEVCKLGWPSVYFTEG